MEKVKLTGKLSLNKETIAELTKDQMSKLQGGNCNYTTIGGKSCTAFGCSGTANTNTPGLPPDCCV